MPSRFRRNDEPSSKKPTGSEPDPDAEAIAAIKRKYRDELLIGNPPDMASIGDDEPDDEGQGSRD